MSLYSQNPDERIFYYSEIPSTSEFIQPECFYFKVLEFNDDNNFLKYVIIARIKQIDNPNSETEIIKFNNPYIPKSIVDATKAINKLLE